MLFFPFQPILSVFISPLAMFGSDGVLWLHLLCWYCLIVWESTPPQTQANFSIPRLLTHPLCLRFNILSCAPVRLIISISLIKIISFPAVCTYGYIMLHYQPAFRHFTVISEDINLYTSLRIHPQLYLFNLYLVWQESLTEL